MSRNVKKATSDYGFRDWVTADGSSGVPAASGRYHLYVSLACPNAHRALMLRSLKGLHSAISYTVLDWTKEQDRGWNFTDKVPKCTRDPHGDHKYLSELYFMANPDYAGKYTVPLLWDTVKKTVVNNESSQIIRMLNNEFNEFCATEERRNLDLYPEHLQDQIDQLNSWIQPYINSGVYDCGFAHTQEEYDQAIVPLFKSLDKVEEILSTQRYLTGSTLTEADIKLFATLVRFDMVYVGHFKCNKKRVIDYPNLWAYTRDMYQTKGIGETVDPEHIMKHYQKSHRHVNPFGIVAIGPDLDFEDQHYRESLVSSKV